MGGLRSCADALPSQVLQACGDWIINATMGAVHKQRNTRKTNMGMKNMGMKAGLSFYLSGKSAWVVCSRRI